MTFHSVKKKQMQRFLSCGVYKTKQTTTHLEQKCGEGTSGVIWPQQTSHHVGRMTTRETSFQLVLLIAQQKGNKMFDCNFDNIQIQLFILGNNVCVHYFGCKECSAEWQTKSQ